MGEPPFDCGADQATSPVPLPGVPVTPVGEPGSVPGVTPLDRVELALVPTALLAVTVKVYGWPFVSPVTVQVSAPVVEQVLPPGAEVTV